MDKVKNLQEKEQVFRKLLELYASEDSDAERLLGWLMPLFMQIEKGQVVPPQKYEHRMALGKEPEFYKRHKDVYSAESDFIAALEDWESQDWYQKLKAQK
jgi:hypothetical protein